MRRRDFIKTTIAMAAATALLPSSAEADVVPVDASNPLPMDQVVFDKDIFDKNDAQTIIIFLSGGMSDVVGNVKHVLEDIIPNDMSLKKYPDKLISPTDNGFWKEAGGDYLEDMLVSGNLNVFRTCYNPTAALAHGINQKRYMNGNEAGFNSGIVTTLMHVLNRNNAVSKDAILTNVAINGSDYRLLEDGATPTMLPDFLRPASFNRNLQNVYNYAMTSDGLVSVGDTSATEKLNAANFSTELTALSQEHNLYDALSDIFNRRGEMSDFLDEIVNGDLPVQYPSTVDGTRVEAAMRILINNPSTKIVSMVGGYNGWDDHSNAIENHTKRASQLFEAIKVAIDHAGAVGKDSINIVVFGDFGRNLTLNSAGGWDHGNNQVLYWFGGKKFFNQLGIVGETYLDEHVKKYRLYSHPTDSSYQLRPYSIAATIYALYGVENPEVLTGGAGIIDPVDYTGKTFLRG
ncbi:DUF1501 domain-containing protein [Hydrogenimonas cancrithermarum]|uniref:DUF1501 domain-containing protein n=1 Tax=Hydrogenimonas cancrithermarum TaxID=2993563 RepID=A0ABN6WWM8_9BACT|nr:DUF1501 domain-containing protein [Hydrogenimonas cancrithermarum]BDY13584.1 hypothetical protein HCR_18960 [Hydrogenimonas cancrithermarum]